MNSIDATPEVPQNNDSLVSRVRKWAPGLVSGVAWFTLWAQSGKYMLENYDQTPDWAMALSYIVALAATYPTKKLIDIGIDISIPAYQKLRRVLYEKLPRPYNL